jgi:hypothetical protein
MELGQGSNGSGPLVTIGVRQCGSSSCGVSLG